jgi:DNA-directed RNA polymerase specialized sigma24 family protein
MSESATHDAVEAAARDSYGRLVAYIASRTGDIADAQDALSEALVAALETWPRKSVPDKPEAWLLHVARNRLIDASRREQTRREAEPKTKIRDAGIPFRVPDPPELSERLSFVPNSSCGFASPPPASISAHSNSENMPPQKSAKSTSCSRNQVSSIRRSFNVRGMASTPKVAMEPLAFSRTAESGSQSRRRAASMASWRRAAEVR